MSWKRYCAERVVASACWLVVVAVAVYVIYHVLAPFPEPLAGPSAPTQNRERALEYFAEDLGDYAGRLLHGSLGEPITGGADVNEIVARAAPVTIAVAVGAAALALLIGGFVGLAWSGRRLRGVSVAGQIALALLPVWFGIHLSYWIGFRGGVTPIAGYCDLFFPPAGAQCGGPSDWAHHLLLPWTTLALPLAFLYARLVRALTADVRGAVASARPEDRTAVRRHRARTAEVAITRHVARDLGFLLGLAAFVEIIFGLPGLGSTLYQSAYPYEYRLGEAIDAPVGEGVLLAAALLAIAVPLVVDVTLAAFVPDARAA